MEQAKKSFQFCVYALCPVFTVVQDHTVKPTSPLSGPEVYEGFIHKKTAVWGHQELTTCQ